jgi:hypothetical protein
MFWERSQTSLVHRVLEGFSAGLSFFVVGIYYHKKHYHKKHYDLSSYYHNHEEYNDLWLWVTYFVHWCFAFYFHLTYSPAGHKADREMIRLMIGERLQRVDPFTSRILRLWYIFQPTTKDVRMMAVIATLVTAWKIWRLSSWYYIGFHMMALFCNCMADELMYGHGSTLFTVFFHVFLAMATGYETHIVSSPSEMIDVVMRYACWLMVIVRIVHNFTSWPSTKMFRICSLTCSLVLSPIGIYECVKIIWYRENIPCSEIELVLYDRPPHVEEFDYRVHSLCFYLAYVFVDMYLGTTEFTEHFRWLEGVIHHVVTGLVAFFSIMTGNTFPMCAAFIAEVPTIVMTLRHFLSLPRWLFPFLFLSFRIVLLGYMVHLSFGEGQIGWIWVILYIIFTLVNLHWFTKMMIHSFF